MYILLAGEVAIYKLRDQEEVMLEEQYYEDSQKILDSALVEHLKTYGYASKDLIDNHMDEEHKAKYKHLEHIKASTLRSCSS